MKKIKCDWDFNDFLQLEVVDGSDVIITAKQNGNKSKVRINPEKIRKLRKQLKRALIEIEGGSGAGEDCDCGPREEEKTEWKPKPGDKVRFVDDKTLDLLDVHGWHPKNGEIYVVKHFYDANEDERLYRGISLEETPKTKSTALDYGYKFRLSGFRPA